MIDIKSFKIDFFSEHSFKTLAYPEVDIKVNMKKTNSVSFYPVLMLNEERHLSLDLVYVEYATTINKKGIFKRLYKVFPFLN